MRLQQFIDRLEGYCECRGVAVRRTALHAHVLGQAQAGHITLRSGLSKEQQLLTLAHELTHVLVHYDVQPRINRTICEYEAYAVERVVGWTLGLRSCAGDSGESVTDDLLACSVERVKRVSAALVQAALGEAASSHRPG